MTTSPRPATTARMSILLRRAFASNPSHREEAQPSNRGTSMAAPHVTGAAAIFLAVNRSATPAQVRSWLLGNARPQSSAEGFTGDPDGFPEPLVWLGGGKPVVTAPYKLVASGASVNSAASTYVRDGKLSTVWKTKPIQGRAAVRGVGLGRSRRAEVDREHPLGLRRGRHRRLLRDRRLEQPEQLDLHHQAQRQARRRLAGEDH